MKPEYQTEDLWQYATFDGVERMQFRQVAKMSLSERLIALDDMIRLAGSIRSVAAAVGEESPEYGDKNDK